MRTKAITTITITAVLALAACGDDGQGDSAFGNLGNRTECVTLEEGLTVEEVTELIGSEPINSEEWENSVESGIVVHYPEGNVDFVNGRSTNWILAGSQFC